MSMGKAKQTPTPILIPAEVSANEASSHFSPEERSAIRASLRGVARQRGVELSEADLRDRVETAILAYEKLAGWLAMRKARGTPLTKQREQMVRLKANMLAAFPTNTPDAVLKALDVVEVHITTYGVLIEANSHGRNSFRSLVCGYVMHVWTNAGGKLSAKVTAEHGSGGPLIEHLELMLRLFKAPVPQRITLRKYVSSERLGRERLLEWLRLNPRPRASDDCPS
jgi:hypothetical protein